MRETTTLLYSFKNSAVVMTRTLPLHIGRAEECSRADRVLFLSTRLRAYSVHTSLNAYVSQRTTTALRASRFTDFSREVKDPVVKHLGPLHVARNEAVTELMVGLNVCE